MAQPNVPERFTHTRLFREYSWLSDVFLSGTWVEAASETAGLKSYGEFLLKLDHQVPLYTSIMYSDSEWRALLGLDNVHFVERDQVLDVLLAAKYGTSDMPCIVHPMPSGTKQAELLTSLSTWPARITKFQTSWGKQVDHERKESKKKGRTSSGAAVPDTSSSGPAPDCEAWGLVQQLSGMTTKSLVQKTTKNLNSVMSCTNTRTPRLAYMEDLILTVVRDIAIGNPAASAIRKFLAPDSKYLKTGRPPTSRMKISLSATLETRESLPTPDLTRKRARTRPLQLDLPPSSSGRTIATALASSLCSVPQGSADVTDAWSSLIPFEEDEPTGQAANDVGSSVAAGVSVCETVTTVADELQPAAVEGLPVSEDRSDDQPGRRCSCTFIAMYPAMAGGYIGLKALLGCPGYIALKAHHGCPAKMMGDRAALISEGAGDSSGHSIRMDRNPRLGRLSPFQRKAPRRRSEAQLGQSGLSNLGERVERVRMRSRRRKKTEAEGPSNKRKNRSDHQTPTSKKRKTKSIVADNSVLLEDVEANPPQKRCRCGDIDPMGRNERFLFRCIKLEKPMLEQLQQAIERQQRSFGDAAFVRHVPGHLPTQRARADEPNFYVLSEAEWKALSRHEQVVLYQTGRNLFISGMTVGDLDIGVEESVSILHRLDEEIEVQGKSPLLFQGVLTDGYHSERVAYAASFNQRRRIN
ncbi:hypothetical protein B0H14DRAFT_2580938 [Mycena olivaceomarginata]|nr:hypothetical protein B0H14DRAFT_2580938 [Mycena olivaceomarginata]